MTTSRQIEQTARRNGLGRTEAQAFAYVAYWNSKASHEHEGRLWTYCTKAALADELGVSVRTIDRALDLLEQRCLIQRRVVYHRRRRGRVTLLRLDEAGERLSRDSAASSQSGRLQRRRGGVVPHDEMAARSETEWQAPTRQDGGSHLSSGLPEDLLRTFFPEETEEKNFTSKESREEKVEEDGGTAIELIDLINVLLREQNLPQWNRGSWTQRQAAHIIEAMNAAGLSFDGFAEFMTRLLRRWPETLWVLPPTYRNYPDNHLRPSPKCLADMFGPLNASEPDEPSRHKDSDGEYFADFGGFTPDCD